MKNMISLKDYSSGEVRSLIEMAAKVKSRPLNYSHIMRGKTLLMIFEKPSLRTRLSFETGAFQLGGHPIYYDMRTSPMGAGKESISDSIKVISRFNDIVMARLNRHEDMLAMAEHASIPVINALTDYSHPCQILADLLTIREHKGELRGLKLAYLGDANNNVTHSLLFGCALCGIDISVGCPDNPELRTGDAVLADARALAEGSGAKVDMNFDPAAAVDGADVVYTDSWMSYHIPKDKQDERVESLMPYQVDAGLMSKAKPDAIFMNCLPAMRGYEQTAEVIDGPQSVVFDQAENRLYAQKAVMIRLLTH
jgi:ornithine carbamoyltransferase